MWVGMGSMGKRKPGECGHALGDMGRYGESGEAWGM